MKKVLFKKMLTIMMAFFIVVGLMPAMNVSVYADEGPVATVVFNDGTTQDFETMSKVFSSIIIHKGGTINLNRDWDYQDNGTTWTGPFIIGGGETVTINLNGHIMNRHLAGDVESSSAVSDGCLFHVREDSTLIINGGKDASDASITTWHMGRTSQGIWMTEDDFGSIKYGGGMLAGGYNSDGGGCITADAGANVTLNNVTLAGNISSYGGGAVYLGGSNSNPSHLQVNNSKLEYNKSISSHGGAICSDYGYVTINKGSSISHNKATGSYYGGGIYANANLEGSLIIEGTVINGEKSIQINDNTADQGGGIYLNYGEKSIIRNTNIEDNKAVNLDSDATRSLVSIGSGGGIFVNEDDFFIANCIVKNNKASGDGGGIYCGKTFCYTTRCSITNNYCKVEGGGVCVANTSNTIDNCTIQDNSCTVSGGGICLKKSPLFASNVLTLSGNVIADDNTSLSNNQQYRDNLYIANRTSNLNLGYLPMLNVDNLSLGSNIGITATTGSTRYITDATSCNPCCLFSDQDSIYCISKATDSDKIYIKKRVADDPYNLTAITSTNTIKDQHKSGETVTINAATPTGKIFDHWEISGLSSGVNAPAMPTTAVGTFIMPASNFTATAVYKDKISSASLTIAAPAGGTDLTESAATNLTGINATTGIVWTDSDGNKVSGKAAYNTAYTATVTLTKDEANKVEFTSPFTAGVNGNAAAGTCTYYPADGSVVITYTFAATPKAKLTAQPANPAGISVYTGKTKDDVIAMLPSAIAVQTEDGTKMASVTWASATYDSSSPGGYTFTGTLDLNTLNVDPDTVNKYTGTVTTTVTVLSKQKATTPTVTSDNPATSTQEQTVKLATATPGATIMYKLQTNDVPTSGDYTAYSSGGIKLAVPTEGQTTVYKITAYTVSTDSGIMDNSAQVTFTYVISKPISNYKVNITCSDTRSYGEGETPWTDTVSAFYANGSNVILTAPNYESKVFDHWEVVSTTAYKDAAALGLTAEALKNRTITITGLKGIVELKAIYHDTVSSVALTITEPSIGTDLEASAATNLTGVNAKPGIVWTDAANKVSGKAAYNTAYTATVTLTKDEANKVEFSSTTASPFTATVNLNAAACTYDPADGSVVITYTFAATPKAKLTAQPANPADISVYTGKTKDAVIAMLPSAIAIQTEDGTKMASVKWASDSFNSNQAASYTFTGTLDLNTLNVDPDTVNNYTDIVTTTVTVQAKEMAAAPTVTSDNPATSTQEQTVKLATETTGAKIMYKLQTNDGPTSGDYTAYTSGGIKLAVPTEGQTTVYKITAYTVSTNSGSMDDSAPVTFTYVISTPMPKCTVTFTCSDTRSYGEGETPWTATVSTQYANGSNVILTAPNYENKVFDHWETVSGTTGITDANKVNRTITIAVLQGDVVLKAIYRDTVSSVALTITEPSIGTDLVASADTGLTGVNATPGIVWTDAANKVSGKAAYNTAYTATVTLTNDKANNVEFSSTTASPFTATVNRNAAACTYYPADGSIVITYTFAATPKAKLTAQPANPAGISVYTGKTKDAVIAMLPSAIAVQTEDGTKPAKVTWDSAAYDSSKPGNYTFTGTLDLAELNNDKNTYSNTVSTTVTVLSKQIAASPTVTSGNPATSTQNQTVKLATATTGATIKYTVSENNGTDTASADYTNAGILLKAPFEGQTTVYKITAYTVSTDSGSMDDSAPVTFTYVISTPMPKYTVTFTGSDTGIYVNGATPWSVTRTADYTKGSNVTLTAPQDNDKDFADEVFDHWEVVSGNASLDAAALNKRTITISNLQGAVELKAIYNPVVKTIDLTLTPPEAGKQLSTAATKCIVTVTNPHDVTRLISIAWSPAASTAAYSTVYTAAVKLDKDIINQYAPNLKFFFADNIIIKVNGNTATGTLVGNGSDAIIYIPFAKTDTKLLSISQPADIYAANGTEASVVQGKLPSKVSIRTTDETVKTASVAWETVRYDKTKVTGQDITVNGTVTIPDTVKNLDSISKSVSLTVHFGAAEQAERPQSSLKSGSYTGTQEIKLTSRTEGAKIYYSTDGSEPNKLYTAPITISGSATVNAMSKKSGYRDSDVESFSYTVTQPFNYTPPTPERKAPQIILLKAVSGKTSVKLTWTAVDGATKYVIYGGRCGAGSKYAKLKTVSADAVSCTFQDLKAHRSYKYYVVAYGDTDRLCTSRTTHVVVVSSYTDRYNATKVTAADADVSLTAGNSAQIEAKVYTLSGKALFGEGHCPIIRFVTADSSIATVSKTGEITAVSEGTTTIYILAPNGIRTAVKVTVEH